MIPPPLPQQLSLSTEAEDMAVVEGIGNQVMGLAARGIVTFMEVRWGVKLGHDDLQRIQRLYLLTDVEKAMLRPTARHVAGKARELIGSDSNIALGVAGSTFLTGLMDRHREITGALAPLIEKRIAELQAEAEAQKKKGQAGA